MEEHQLSTFDLHTARDPFGRLVLIPPNNDMCCVEVAMHGARFFGSDITWQMNRTTGKRHITIFGKESSRVTSELMIPFWWGECKRMARESYRALTYPQFSEGKLRRDTMLAFSRRLHRITPDKAYEDLETATKYLHEDLAGNYKVVEGRSFKISQVAINTAEKVSIGMQVNSSRKGVFEK